MLTERQYEITEVALNLINTRGIQGLTMKNLSKDLGISEPAIYRHFENKIEILVAILDRLQLESKTIFKKQLQNGDSAFVMIEKLLEGHFEMFTKKPSLTSVVFSEEIFYNETLLLDKLKEIMNNNHGILYLILKKGQEKKEIRRDVDAEQLVLILMGTLRLFVKKWHLDDFNYDLKRDGKKLIATFRTLLIP